MYIKYLNIFIKSLHIKNCEYRYIPILYFYYIKIHIKNQLKICCFYSHETAFEVKALFVNK